MFTVYILKLLLYYFDIPLLFLNLFIITHRTWNGLCLHLTWNGDPLLAFARFFWSYPVDYQFGYRAYQLTDDRCDSSDLFFSGCYLFFRLSFVLCLNCLCLDLFSIEIFIYQYYCLQAFHVRCDYFGICGSWVGGFRMKINNKNIRKGVSFFFGS